MTLTGPDVSHHQGTVNWSAVHGAGHSFAFAKATEGTGFVSSTYQVNEAGMKAAGLVAGAYHFMQPGNGAAQADHFLDVVGEPNGMLCTVDVETTSSGAHPSSADAHAFADRFAEQTGGHPLILYTGRWYWKDILGDPYGADIGPLWHSAYSSSPGALYGGWGEFTFWQWTSSGSCPGISGGCDLNYFYGDRDALVALTSPTGADMPLTEADLNAIAAKLFPFMEVAADNAAKQLAKFGMLGGVSTLFDPAAAGNEWMADAQKVANNDLSSAIGEIPTTSTPGSGATPAEVDAAIKANADVYVDAAKKAGREGCGTG
jgi:GH25 family lysozyme M1 (1,4-beta-N-acetylmuramidase)